MKKILIVGATSAIAQEVAKIYAQEKSELVLLGRSSQNLEIIRKDLQVRGAGKVHTIAQDLTDFKSHANVIDTAWNHLQSFDVVLLAHGVLGNQKEAERDNEELINIVNSNYLSHASLLTYIAQKMLSQHSGTIAVISSVAGDRGRQSNYVYGSAMAGKTTFVDGLRNRLFASGIHVVTLKLGFVDSPMTKDFKKGPLWAQPAAIATGIVKAIESKRNSIYLPFFWRYIMLIIRFIPETLFKKLKL